MYGTQGQGKLNLQTAPPAHLVQCQRPQMNEHVFVFLRILHFRGRHCCFVHRKQKVARSSLALSLTARTPSRTRCSLPRISYVLIHERDALCMWCDRWYRCFVCPFVQRDYLTSRIKVGGKAGNLGEESKWFLAACEKSANYALFLVFQKKHLSLVK